MVLILPYALAQYANKKHLVGAGIIDSKSFIHKIKSKKPKTVPCGTSLLT